MMKKYQIIIIFTPDVTIEKMEKILAMAIDVNLSRIDKWGIRTMAYEVRQKKTKIWYKQGYFVAANIHGTDEEIDKFKKKVENTNEIIKTIIVRTEK